MPDITMTRQTNLRGQALHSAIDTMAQNLSRRSPFDRGQLSTRWESATRMTFTGTAYGQTQANGSVDIRDGSPSTVTVQINLLTPTARLLRSTFESAMVEESDRALQPVAGSAQTAAQTPAQTSTQSASSSHGDFDWNLFSTIVGGVIQQAGNTVQSYNQAAGYTAQIQAQDIAAETARKAGIPAPAPRASVVRTQAAATQPVAPVQSGPAMSTIGWIVIGAVGLGVVGLIIAVAAKKSKKEED